MWLFFPSKLFHSNDSMTRAAIHVTKLLWGLYLKTLHNANTLAKRLCSHCFLILILKIRFYTYDTSSLERIWKKGDNVKRYNLKLPQILYHEKTILTFRESKQFWNHFLKYFFSKFSSYSWFPLSQLVHPNWKSSFPTVFTIRFNLLNIICKAPCWVGPCHWGSRWLVSQSRAPQFIENFLS